MKKLLLALIIFITPVKAYALQDYLIFSDKPVKSVSVEDKSILRVFPVQTIDNSKQTIILKPIKEGKTSVTIKTFESQSVLKVKVKKDETLIKDCEGFDFMPADIPSENLMIDGIEILPPPKKMGGK